MTTYPPLTAVQVTMVSDFAFAHGRYWKASLRELWERGSRRPELQELRNTHGPLWLKTFQPSSKKEI